MLGCRERLPSDRQCQLVGGSDQLVFQAGAFKTALEVEELSCPNVGTFHGHLLARTSLVKKRQGTSPCTRATPSIRWPKISPGKDRLKGQGELFCQIVGGVLSPLLANLYMRRFVLGWKGAGHEQRLQARIVNYADDFVICCRGTAAQAMHAMRDMMERLKLTVNERKTRIGRVPGETFPFLGYTIGECYSFRRQRLHIGQRPAKTAVQRICRAIREMTSRRWAFLPVEDIVRGIKQRLAGWANYFQLGSVSLAYRVVDQHTRYRLCTWLRWKHKAGRRGSTRLPAPYLYRTLGLICLPRLTRFLPWAQA